MTVFMRDDLPALPQLKKLTLVGSFVPDNHALESYSSLTDLDISRCIPCWDPSYWNHCVWPRQSCLPHLKIIRVSRYMLPEDVVSLHTLYGGMESPPMPPCTIILQ